MSIDVVMNIKSDINVDFYRRVVRKYLELVSHVFKKMAADGWDCFVEPLQNGSVLGRKGRNAVGWERTGCLLVSPHAIFV